MKEPKTAAIDKTLLDEPQGLSGSGPLGFMVWGFRVLGFRV